MRNFRSSQYNWYHPEVLKNRLTPDSAQVAKLIHELQSVARAAGHEKPLLIALDQEHGMVLSHCSASNVRSPVMETANELLSFPALWLLQQRDRPV